MRGQLSLLVDHEDAEMRIAKSERACSRKTDDPGADDREIGPPITGARSGHVNVYSGPEPPSGGVRRPPLALIAPHCTQFDGVTFTETVPSPLSSPTS